MRVDLVAVQAALSEAPFEGAAPFAAWIRRLAREAMASLPDDHGEVVLAFPEAIAMPLLFTLGGAGRVAGSATLLEAGWRSLRGGWAEVATAAWRHRAPGPAAVHLARALRVHDAYVSAFRAVARETGATVVGGSAFLPEIDVEAARGPHVVGRRVHNVAYTFAPGGALLGRSRKVYLTPGLESRVGLSRGRLPELPVMRAPCGSLGVAVCLDGWYEGVVAALDAQGAQILVQPSANDAAWDRPWPPDPRLLEGEAWLERGLRARLQGRVHLRYGLNPMLVGEVFGFAPRGRSSVVANAKLVRHAWVDAREGVVALAPDAEREAYVHAAVTLPGPGPHPGSGPRPRR